MTTETRPDWMPIDPDATTDQQRLLDEANGLLAALRILDAGERLTGYTAESEHRRIMARLDAIREELA